MNVNSMFQKLLSKMSSLIMISQKLILYFDFIVIKHVNTNINIYAN